MVSRSNEAWLWIGNWMFMLINLNNTFYTCTVEGWKCFQSFSSFLCGRVILSLRFQLKLKLLKKHLCGYRGLRIIISSKLFYTFAIHRNFSLTIYKIHFSCNSPLRPIELQYCSKVQTIYDICFSFALIYWRVYSVQAKGLAKYVQEKKYPKILSEM